MNVFGMFGGTVEDLRRLALVGRSRMGSAGGPVLVNNTAAKTPVLTYTVPAQSLRRGGRLGFAAALKVVKAKSGGAEAVAISVELDGVSIATMPASGVITNDTFVFVGGIEMANDEDGYGGLFAAGVSGGNSFSDGNVIEVHNVDHTAAAVLTINVDWAGSAHADNQITVYNAAAGVIPPVNQ